MLDSHMDSMEDQEAMELPARCCIIDSRHLVAATMGSPYPDIWDHGIGFPVVPISRIHYTTYMFLGSTAVQIRKDLGSPRSAI